MAVAFNVRIPVANSLKFVRDGIASDRRANFDQQRFSQLKNVGQDKALYFQPFEKADPLRIQFYTNFPNKKVNIVNCDGEISSQIPTLFRQFKGLSFYADAKTTEYNDKALIWFDAGYTYTDGTYATTDEYINWAGRLPNINAQIGDTITWNIVGNLDVYVTTIIDIVWDSERGVEGYLVDRISAFANPVSIRATVVYNEKNVDLFQTDIDLSVLDEDYYTIEIEAGIGDDGSPLFQYKWISEPIDLRESHIDTLAIDYQHTGEFNKSDYYQFIYDGYTARKRINANFFEYTASGETDIYRDDTGIMKKIRAVPYRVLTIEAGIVPAWEADKLNVIFGHDTLVINGYYWQCEELGNFEAVDRTGLGTYTVELDQVTDRLSKSDELIVEITSSFTPDEINDDGTGDVYNVTFNSDLPEGVFNFINLPSWISAPSDFVNNDILTLTISAGVATERSVVLMATDADGLSFALISVSQEAVASAGLIISVSPTNTNVITGVSDIISLSVVADMSAIWQASSNKFWAIPDNTLYVGNDTISVTIKNSGTLGDVATITIVNTEDPSDFKIATITKV